MILRKKIIVIGIFIIFIFLTVYFVNLMIVEEIRLMSGYAEEYQRIYDECCPEFLEGHMCLVDYFPVNSHFIFGFPLIALMWGGFLYITGGFSNG